jgi:ligand-binding sensor domain-containing protein/DNA-binding CsgD family transcriptional regulator
VLLNCLFWGISGTILGQKTIFNFEQLTISTGLSHNTVYCTLQDKKGVMWFGTQNGLNRFDGLNFTVFPRHHNDETFRGTTIQCIFEDYLGNLWVGTQNKGINRRSPLNGKFINTCNQAALSVFCDAWVKVIAQDRQGYLWFGSIGKGLLRYHPITGFARLYTSANSKLCSDNVFDVLEDELGQIWVATSGKGVCLFDPKTQQFKTVFPADNPVYPMEGYRKCLQSQHDGTLWVGTDLTGLYALDIRTKQCRPYTLLPAASQAEQFNIMDLALYDSLLLIATDGDGLLALHPRSGHCQTYSYKVNTPGGINSSAVLNLSVDMNKNIWVGTYNGGVNLYQRNKVWFDTYTHTGSKVDELSHRSVLDMCQANDGKIWIGTDGGGINVFDPQGQQFRYYTHNSQVNSPAADVVKTIFQDALGNLWIGYFNGGLDKLSLQTGQFTHYRYALDGLNSIGSNNVWDICQDQQGTLWLATQGGGLDALDPNTGLFKHYTAGKGARALSENNLMCLLHDVDGQLWIGTNSQGLNILDTKNVDQGFTVINELNSQLGDNNVRSIFQDRQGFIWVGTENGGLHKFKGQTLLARYGTQQGFLSNAIMGITQDVNGDIWLSTYSGLCRFNPKTERVENYDFAAAAEKNQYNQAAILSATDGKLYFGGIYGFQSINPLHTQLGQNMAQTIINSFSVFNTKLDAGDTFNNRVVFTKPIEYTDKISLRHYENVFAVGFVHTDYNSPHKNSFLYKCDGFDDKWQQTAAGQHEVTYTNLNPGEYTFRVKAKDYAQEAIIKIVIKPPFWKTVWFKSALFLLICFILLISLKIVITRREITLRSKVLLSEREILRLNNEKLNNEIESQKTELMQKALEMAHKNEMLISIREKLESIKDEPEQNRLQAIRKLSRELENSLVGEESWDQFIGYFNIVNQSFSVQLLNQHPDLTPNDLRICALTILNLSTKETAALLNISVKGVEKSRYRLKKRLNLEPEDSLLEYLRKFS